MIKKNQIVKNFSIAISSSSERRLQLQRACGNHTLPSIECEEYKNKREGLLQRATINSSPVNQVPPIGHEVLHSPGQPLDAQTRASTGPRLWHDFSQVQIQNITSHVSGMPGNSVGAALPQSDDPLHQPGIDRFREEHGFPRDGINEEDRQVGPSNAEIKYGGLSVAPQPSSSVFFVSFQNVSPPPAPDHSQVNPGPNVTGANRAGYTRVRLQKRMNIVWDNGPVDSSGRIPLYIRSVNIFYRLDPIETFVSSNYVAGSCPYRVTLTHEQSHVNAFLQIFHAGRELLLGRLSRAAIPTPANPTLINPADAQTAQNRIGESLRQFILLHSAELVSEMEADRTRKDTPSEYRAVYAQCPSAEW